MRIELHNVSKSFGATHVLKGVNLDITFEHTLALVGPSGGGKSTLLRLLAGLDVADSGSIRVDGVELSTLEPALCAYRREIGVVFQAYNLFPHLTALQNVVLPLVHVHGLSAQEAETRARVVLDRFQLSEHSAKQPGQLSGGQRQRVAIARALAIDPRLLLLDEPTSALDPEMTAEVLDVIAELRESGTPLVLVTHEMGFARHTADFVAFVAGGKIPEHGPGEVFFENSNSPDVRRFLGKILKY